MNLTREEMETIINCNEEDNEADVYTASKIVMRRLDKMCKLHPDLYRCIERKSYQATYRCPKDRIKFANPATEKQKQANRVRALKYGFKSVEMDGEKQ